MFRFALHVAIALAFGLAIAAAYFADGKFPRNFCEMSYMAASYVPISFPNSPLPGYRLFRFQASPTIGDWKQKSPVLFVPGNAGDFKQARTLGSQVDPATTVVYTVDFNSQYSGVSGLLLARQARFVELCIAAVAKLHGGDAKVTVVGHSMGSVAAWPSVMGADDNSVDRLFALCAPLQRPMLGLRHLQAFYREHVWSTTTSSTLLDKLVVSIGCGRRDVMVPSTLSLIPTNTSAASLELLASSVVLLSESKEQDPIQLRNRMASSETSRTWFELFVFGLRLHWPQLFALVFSVLCLAMREAKRGWFFPPALRSLQRTSLVFGILPFAVLVPDFWVSLWLFLFAVGMVSLVVFMGFTLSERVFARVLVRRTKHTLVKWTIGLGMGSALVGAITIGMDLALVFIYGLLVWLCGFWWMVDGRGVWALCLGVVLAVEAEALLLCLDSVMITMQHGASTLTWEEKRAVGESLVVFVPWLVLALRVVRNKSKLPAIVEETMLEQAEEPKTLPPIASSLKGECQIVLEPWTGGNDVLEFLSDLDYLDKTTSVLVTTLSGEVVQVDDLVSQRMVEKDANAVSIVNPSKPPKPLASTASSTSSAPLFDQTEAEEEERWPKWAVWMVQLLALGCLIRPDDALPVLSQLAAALCVVLLQIHP
ncbi:hypothetical protein BASA81_003639 [Batrachochytrium salamandrivorans]|nr:hypothetical protein BASA81_003639 [Batrachochytrium salamandrivorans]